MLFRSVGVAGWLKGSGGRLHLLLLASAMAAAHLALVVAPDLKHLAPSLVQLTGAAPFVTAFLVGACTYCFRDELGLGRASAAVWTVVALILLKFGGWNLLSPFVLPLALINLAYSFRIRLRHDLSYGIYVFHFPILQVMAAFGLMKFGYAGYLRVALVLSVACASVSWLAVERPFLRLKRATPSAVP